MSYSTCVKSAKIEKKILYKLLTGIYPFEQNQFYIDGVKFQLKRRNKINSSQTKNYLRITMLDGKKINLNLHNISYNQFVFFDSNYQLGLAPVKKNDDPCLFHIHIAVNQFYKPSVKLQVFKLNSIKSLSFCERLGSDYDD